MTTWFEQCEEDIRTLRRLLEQVAQEQVEPLKEDRLLVSRLQQELDLRRSELLLSCDGKSEQVRKAQLAVKLAQDSKYQALAQQLAEASERVNAVTLSPTDWRIDMLNEILPYELQLAELERIVSANKTG